MVAFLQNHERVQLLETKVQETQEALKLLMISFEEGLTDFTGVFVMQGALVGAQDKLASTRGDVVTSLISLISLYKALGGGWQIRCAEFQPRLLLTVDPGSDANAEEIPTPAGPSLEREVRDTEEPPVSDSN